MDFKEIVMKRYASKEFDGKKIPQEKVDELLELIRYSASSFNLQTWKVKVIEDQETKDKLLAASMNQPQITTCSHLLVFCADANIMSNIKKIEKMMKDAGVPEAGYKGYIDMMIGFESSMNDAKRVEYAKEQVFIALGNALNGAASLGFDSCPSGGFNPVEFKKILELPENLHPAVLCPIGYGADEPKPKMRFSKEDVFF